MGRLFDFQIFTRPPGIHLALWLFIVRPGCQCALSRSRYCFLSANSCHVLINSSVFHFSFPWINCHFRVCTKSYNIVENFRGKAIGHLRILSTTSTIWIFPTKNPADSPGLSTELSGWDKITTTNNSKAGTVIKLLLCAPNRTGGGRGEDFTCTNIILAKSSGVNNYFLDERNWPKKYRRTCSESHKLPKWLHSQLRLDLNSVAEGRIDFSPQRQIAH